MPIVPNPLGWPVLIIVIVVIVVGTVYVMWDESRHASEDATGHGDVDLRG